MNEEKNTEFTRINQLEFQVDLIKDFIRTIFNYDILEKKYDCLKQTGIIKVYDKDINMTKIFYMDHIDTASVSIKKVERYYNNLKKCYISHAI